MYHDALRPLKDDIILPGPASNGMRSWFVYVIRLRDHFGDGARDELLEHLQANGIGCAPYFPPIHLQPYHRSTLECGPGDFPECERLAARTIALPFYPSLSHDAIRRVGRAIEEKLPSLPPDGS